MTSAARNKGKVSNPFGIFDIETGKYACASHAVFNISEPLLLKIVLPPICAFALKGTRDK